MTPVFCIVALFTLAGGLAAVTLKNTVHCALALTVALAGLALFFLRLDAQFVGFAQILIYIGAVAILVVFAILLTRSSEPEASGGIVSSRWLAGVIIAAAVFAVLGWAILRSAPALAHESAAPAVTVHQIGTALMGRYVLPLEIVALLLTSALIGAVIVAMHENGSAK